MDRGRNRGEGTSRRSISPDETRRRHDSGSDDKGRRSTRDRYEESQKFKEWETARDARNKEEAEYREKYETIQSKVAEELKIGVPDKEAKEWKDFSKDLLKEKEELSLIPYTMLHEIMEDKVAHVLTNKNRNSDQYKDLVKEVLEKFEEYKNQHQDD